MKRIFSLALISTIVMCMMMLSGCSIFETEHTHEFGEWTVEKDASCTEDGVRIRSCSCGGKESERIFAKGHTEEIVAGPPATCTESGLAEGKKCAVCGEITVEQEEIASLGHNCRYFERTDENGNITTFGICQRTDCDGVIENPAGLYDSENHLLASWDELKNVYWLNNLKTTLENNEKLKCGTKFIIDDSTTDIEDIKGVKEVEDIFS